MTAGSTGIGGPGKSRPTRRGVLVGASLAGLGGALAGCSTAAVPYGANEAGVVEHDTPAAPGNRVWTDDYSNLLAVLRWGSPAH